MLLLPQVYSNFYVAPILLLTLNLFSLDEPHSLIKAYDQLSVTPKSQTPGEAVQINKTEREKEEEDDVQIHEK